MDERVAEILAEMFASYQAVNGFGECGERIVRVVRGVAKSRSMGVCVCASIWKGSGLSGSSWSGIMRENRTRPQGSRR